MKVSSYDDQDIMELLLRPRAGSCASILQVQGGAILASVSGKYAGRGKHVMLRGLALPLMSDRETLSFLFEKSGNI